MAYKYKLMEARNSGFSFIELTIVLTIIAVIVGTGFSASKYRDRLNPDLTRDKMEQVSNSISAFVAINGRLPCPANPRLAQSEPNFGLEYCNRSSSDMLYYSKSGTIFLGGAVPVRTLQLPDSLIADSWGYRFTYGVVQDLAGSGDYGTPTTKYHFSEVDNYLGFEINDPTGETITDEAAMVLVSHGENGNGAISYTGGARRATSSSNKDELENMPADPKQWNNIFVVRGFADNVEGTYDDIVLYRTKKQLVHAAGAKFADSTCVTANQALNSGTYSASNLCNPGLTNCTSFITALALRLSKYCLLAPGL